MVSWGEKTEKLKERFDARKTVKMKCNICKEPVYSKEIWESIKEVLEHHKKQDSEHLIHQINTGKDLFFYECSECDAGTQFEPNSA